MDKKKDKYSPICTRYQIGKIFYPEAKVPANGLTKTYANDPAKRLQFEAMDLGVYCIDNGIDGEMLRRVDGDTFKILIDLVIHMQDRICTQENISPELLGEFKQYMQFREIQSQMSGTK